MIALVLAAGKGTRLLPLTETVPKAMVQLHGKPLLEHVLLSLRKAGIIETIIVVGHLKEKIIGCFGSDFQGMKISYVEQKEQLGNAHAVLQAEALLKEDFLLGFADVIPKPGVWKSLLKAKGFDAVAIVRREKNPERFGVVETKAKLLVKIEEKPRKPKTNLIAAGFYRLSPKIFEAIKKIPKSASGEYYITDAVNLLAKQGRVAVVESKEKFLDIGTLQDLKKAEKQ